MTAAAAGAALPRQAAGCAAELRFSLGLAALATLGWFLLTARTGFDLSDEGFFWLGAQRTLHGEMPLLDFAAYDIGRYFYTALVFLLLGDDGILAARIAGYSVLFLVVAIAVYLVCRSRAPSAPLPYGRALLAAALVLGWATPYYKSFDFLACALLLLAASRLFSRPDARGWAGLGLACGVAALIGRNHGVYGIGASLLAAAVLLLQRRAMPAELPMRAALPWAGGVAAGYLPMVAVVLATDGFAAHFLGGIQRQAASGSTNLALPVPWPWKADIETLGIITSLQYAVHGLGFVLVPLFAVAGLWWLARRRRSPAREEAPFAAAVCVAIPYAHYVFSRADLVHLSLSVLPVVLGLLCLPVRSAALGRATGVALLGWSAGTLADTPPLDRLIHPQNWETVHVQGEPLVIHRNMAATHRQSTAALRAHLPAGGSFVALPNMPSLHAEYRMPMPLHAIYVLRPASEQQEQKEIARLASQRPSVILLSDHAQDYNEAQRFSRLRPRLYAWIGQHYRRVDPPGANSGAEALQVYAAR